MLTALLGDRRARAHRRGARRLRQRLRRLAVVREQRVAPATRGSGKVVAAGVTVAERFPQRRRRRDLEAAFEVAARLAPQLAVVAQPAQRLGEAGTVRLRRDASFGIA